ncbi:hypothetical protein G6K88_13875 [Agrobacterium rhizogenes]|uniref:hypothetical protein n=1 Tax=Rhizobium rhizogenes TaxID=359 RepID=UPI00115C899C|nr:hypothetical protein [Rhizobium rhizogenes]NTI03108.1 hypothetical protein [Rhizobium rhizogenes]NTI09912.1 hypothetical protein [Rhizobium rhizogenes]TRB20257.1 hypothetical protein EXN70_26360 [Rhizobium rhizogenes]
MPDRIVGGRVVPDRRKPFNTEPLQEAAESILADLYPGIHKRAENDIDQLPRLLYDGVWRDHGDEIIADIHAFADFHPVAEQRTDEAIKAWSQQSADELEGEYSQSYYRVAVEVGVLAYIKEMRELGQHIHCEQGWHRIIERFNDACSGQRGYGFISAYEKWGGLRLTYRCDQAANEGCREAERVAVERAAVTCEVCGLPGELRRTAWRKTLCDKHAGSRYDDV